VYWKRNLEEASCGRFLVCEAGNTGFAIPIEYLRGVQACEVITPLPQLPEWVVGLTTVRGGVLGVVDLARFLGLGKMSLGTGRLVICAAGARQVAFAVAAARTIVDYAPATLQEMGATGGGVGQYVRGLITTDDRTVPVLDVERLLADDQLVRG
jgi:purine-binding chemotaxis protein CheW